MQSDYFQNNFLQKDFSCRDAGIAGTTKIFFLQRAQRKSVQSKSTLFDLITLALNTGDLGD